MAPGEVAMPLRTQVSAPGRKERAGLGVVPTRLFDCGPLWTRPIDSAALYWRLESFHRPYHSALAESLVEERGRFGHALLHVLHSMPPILLGPPGARGGSVFGSGFANVPGPW